MSQEQYLKSPCAHCNGRISFPASARGMTIACPHCGQQTLLNAAAAPQAAAPEEAAEEPVATRPAPAPAPTAQPKPTAAKPLTDAQKAALAAARAANPVARPAAPRPTAKPADKKSIVVKAQWADGEGEESAKPRRCDYCGTRLSAGVKQCPDCGTIAADKPEAAAPMSWFRRIGFALIFLLMLGAAFQWGRYYLERRPKVGKDGKLPPQGVQLLNAALQGQSGTSLLYVRGTVTNHSDVPWFEVKVECELLDKNGASLGKFSDGKMVLDPHKVFSFNISVLDPDAKSYTNITVNAIR